MEKISKTLFICIFLITISGCQANSSNVKESTINESYYGTQLFYTPHECIIAGDIANPVGDVPDNPFPSKEIGKSKTEAGEVSQEFAVMPLVTAVLPSLIDKGLDFLVEYLKKQKENLTASTTARAYAITEPPRAGTGLLGCMTFVRGTFGPILNDANNADRPSYADQLGLATRPDFVLEVAYVKPLIDKTAVYVQPVYIEFNKTTAKRGKDKQALITISLFAPGVKAQQAVMPALPGAAVDSNKPKKEEEAENLVTFAFAFEELKQGSRINQAHLKGLKTELAEFKGAFPQYANIQISVIETEEGGDLLLKAAAVINENKDKISPVLLKQLKELLGIKDEDKK